MSVQEQAPDWGTLGAPDPETGAAKLLHRVETPCATLRHGFYENGAAIPLHRHAFDSLVYGVGGPAIESSGAGQVVKRRLMFHPKGYAHSLAFCGPTHVLAIELPPLAAPGRMRPAVSTPLPATLYDRVWRVMLRIAENEPNAAITAALGELIEGAGRFMAEPKPAWLWAIVDHLHADWRATQSVRALALRFGVSAQHICRTFKRHLGITIQQYGVLLRLDRARGLLWGTGMPISEVAAETGFADQSHLTRVLGVHSERTPARLRLMGPSFYRGDRIAEVA
jgi:AraC-like DNA-binding protein